MQIPKKLGEKNEDPKALVRITMDKLSEKLGQKTEEIFTWLQKKYAKRFCRLVSDCFVEKNWAENHDIEQLKKDLHVFYREWLKVKAEYEDKRKK